MTGSDWLAAIAGGALLVFVLFAFVKGDRAKPIQSNKHQASDDAVRYKSGQIGGHDG